MNTPFIRTTGILRFKEFKILLAETRLLAVATVKSSPSSIILFISDADVSVTFPSGFKKVPSRSVI